MTYPAHWLSDNLKPSPELWNDNTQLHQLPNVATKNVTDGTARLCTVRAWTPLGVLTGLTQLPATQTTGAGIDGGACGLSKQKQPAAHAKRAQAATKTIAKVMI